MIARLMLLWSVLLPLTGLHAQSVVEAPHVRAELLLEQHTLVRTGEQWAGVRLTPDKGWHVYWQNPGDSGLATRVDWTLPDGLSAGDIHWPYPHAEPLGPLTNYGYSDATLHLIPLQSQDLSAPRADLTAEVHWLVCSDVCIPGSARLHAEVAVAERSSADPRHAPAFAAARAALPQPWPDAAPRHAIADGSFSLAIPGPWTANDRVEYFPIANDLVDHAAPQRIAVDEGELRLTQALSSFHVAPTAEVEGVLVVRRAGGPTQAFSLSSSAGSVMPVAESERLAPQGSAAPDPGLALVLLFAFAGGLILNLMPCVFPVLSLKAMAVIRNRDQSYRHRRIHALAYTAGVVVSCLAIAAVLLGLRAGGAAIGWGFQLQSPVIIGVLAYVMFALGLSLSGLFAVGGRWTGMGQSLTESAGSGGSFFTGVLAVIVASPCTAPFMGVALGVALVQPPLIAASIFAALGLGLASPFLLIGFVPAAASLLPRPGAWMERFKQFMAFPLYLTAVWLVWVAGQQAGPGAMAMLLVGIVFIALTAWSLQQNGRAWRVAGGAAGMAALAMLAQPILRDTVNSGIDDPRSAAADRGVYSDARFDALRAEGRTVFVNVTADWCISCKVNERTTLNSARVREAFTEYGVTYLTADWTRADPDITRVLERYGRSGVPLYLLSLNGSEPQVLPQLLTPELVLGALTLSPPSERSISR